jgi:two-component system, cell cycle sensor histidine kinase and response regulator CckA
MISPIAAALAALLGGAAGFALRVRRGSTGQEPAVPPRESLPLLLDGAAEAIVVHDGRTLLYANRAAASFLKSSALTEAAGRPLAAVLHPALAGALHGIDPAAARGGRIDVPDERGRSRIVGVRHVPAVLQGRPVIQTLLHDPDDFRGTARARLDGERYFRFLIENANDVVTVVTPDALMRYASPSLNRVLGYVPEELLGRAILDYIHPDDRDVLREAFGRAFASDVTISAEARIRHRDGSWRVLEGSGRRLADAAGETVLVLNARDVTERWQLSLQLQQAQKMEAVGRLAGGIAHDFNNLLTGIRGHAAIASRELEDAHPLGTDLREIVSAADRAAALTRQLLAFSRQQVLRPRVLDLNAAIHALERLLCRLIGSDIELIIAAGEGLGSVRVDPVQLDQILVNLALNSRDAMPDGGRLVIETRNARLEPEYTRRFAYPVVPGSYVCITVTDTGCGMAPAVLNQIFEPFFTTKEHGKGVGLGMSTVYGTVKQSGGYIWAYSEVGHGTAIKIYFPRVDQSAEPPEAAPEGDITGGEETILVVEDDATVRALTGRVLRGYGYRVVQAENGRGALDVACAHRGRIDLLLTDMLMPEPGSRELADMVRGRWPDMRLLLTSGYIYHEAPGRGSLPEDCAFIEKPFTPEGLARRVREVLDKPAAWPAQVAAP